MDNPVRESRRGQIERAKDTSWKALGPDGPMRVGLSAISRWRLNTPPRLQVMTNDSISCQQTKINK
ncbi:uncharacterized protein G2W53_013645 [Senna tora]|uniref:Uncharacterized protein n=1 Tax=Senna tora TaxID=362788 RepID=A0A834U0Y1_9FABA|nr:uncharacterized protein G2W53_013645 [Senna tora]